MTHCRFRSAAYSLGLATLVLAAGIATPAAAFELAQTPLHLGAGAKSNFIMALDDSISMFSERALPGGNPEDITWNIDNKSMFATGQPGVLNQAGPYLVEFDALFEKTSYEGEVSPPVENLAFVRSPDFNPSYFHPATTYQPWLKADGTRWPAANASAVAMDPRAGAAYAPENTQLFNLKASAGYSSTTEYILYPGMTIPAGTWVATHSIAYVDPQTQTQKYHSGCGDGVVATNMLWKQLSQAATIAWPDKNGDGTVSYPENWCTLKMRYFPATFYLKSKSAIPAGYGYVGNPKEIKQAFGPGSASLWAYEIRPQNFSSTAKYDEAIQNFANWFLYHRNRFLGLIASTTEALADVDDLRLALFAINHRVPVEMRDMAIPAQRSLIYDQVTKFQATAKLENQASLGNTPNRDAVAHIGEQFRRTDALAPVQKACQVNAGMLFTDGYTSSGTGPTGYNNADGALAPPFRDAYANTMADIVTAYFEGAKTPLRTGAQFPAGLVPVPASCATDPKPWMDCETDLHMRFHAVAFGPKGSIYGVNQAATAAPFVSYPNWNSLGDPKTGYSAVVDELWHATLNGRGDFVNADTPAALTAAIQTALVKTAVGASTAGAVSASASRREDGFLAYVPRYNVDDWTGDLRAQRIDADDTLVDVWSAATHLAGVAPAQRKIHFVDGGTALKPFDLANLGGDAGAVQRLGLPSLAPYGRTVTEIVAYLRGDHAREQKNAGGTLRNRASRLGDVLGSQPAVLGRAGFGYTGLPATSGGGHGPGSYGQFLQTTKATRKPVVFVGANDGMLHAFDASDSGGGKELFAVIPAGVLGNLGALPDPAYKHRYFVDGSPVIGDAWNGAWKSVLLAPMGAGGRSILALDVTDPASGFGAQNFLWEFTDPDLHATLSPPSIVMLEGGTWAAVFGGGIDPVEKNGGKATLFVVDLFTGKLLQKINLPPPEGLNHQEQNGLLAYVAIDRDYDLMADAIYAADYDAQLWRIDVDEQGKASIGNGGQRLFRALDRNGRPLVVTGGIDSFPHHIRGQTVFFGTGRYLFRNADEVPEAGSTQAFFGVWDDPQHPGTFDRASLQPQDILSESIVDGTTARSLGQTPVDWSTQKGWLIDLALKGVPNQVAELVIGKPDVALGRVTFTTFSPAAGNSCVGGGLNRLYSVSATSGVGEIPLPGSVSPVGSIQLPESSGSAPLLSPTLVTSPPPPACVPGAPECPIDPGLPEGDTLVAPSAGCRTALGVLLSDGLLDFDSLSCGRQSWQQLR